MGREVKRVALGFDWPVGKIWKGYLNPYYKHFRKCQHCRGSGLNPETKKISDDWYDFAGTGRRWGDNITQDEVDKLIEGHRLYDFTHNRSQRGWYPKDPIPIVTAAMVNEWSRGRELGHDAINRWICVEQRARRLGVWGHCEHCEGGEIWDTPGDKQKAEEWNPEEPQTGDGWQLWETVSEGSPITPVFATADGLIDYMCQPSDGGKRLPWSKGYDRASTERWVKEIGWAPTFISSASGLNDGITALGKREK